MMPYIPIFYIVPLIISLVVISPAIANANSIASLDNTKLLPKQKSTLILATHIEPPLAYFENDVLVGSNIEVAKLLAERMSLNIRFTHCPFARCLNLLRHGRADIMVGINKNNERENYLSYLEQPYTTRITPVKFYLTKSNTNDITEYDDLKNKTIGVLRGATYFKKFDEDTSLNKIEVTTHKQLVNMFLRGRFDTFLGREISISRHVTAEVYQNEMKPASYIYKKKNDSYIAISKKSSFNGLYQSFSKQLSTLIDNGQVDAIAQKYIERLEFQ